MIVSVETFAQTTNLTTRESKSKTVEFEEKNGSFLKKEYYDLDDVKDVKCQVLIITDLKTNDQIGCLLIGTADLTYRYTGILDYDELGAAIESLEYIQREVIPTTPEVQTRVLYTSRDNVTLGVYSYLSMGSTKEVYKWRVYVKPTIYNDSFEGFNKKHIDKLIENLKKAQTLIEKKTKT